MVIRVEISSKEIADLATLMQGQPTTKKKVIETFVSAFVDAMKKPTKDLFI